MIVFYIGLLVLVCLIACIGWKILMYFSRVLDKFIGNGKRGVEDDFTLDLGGAMKSMKKYVYMVLGVLIGIGIVCAYLSYVLMNSIH